MWCSGLRDLNLSNNGLTWACSEGMASLVGTNTALTVLQMDGNPVGQWGVGRMLQALSRSDGQLQRLSIHNVRGWVPKHS